MSRNQRAEISSGKPFLTLGSSCTGTSRERSSLFAVEGKFLFLLVGISLVSEAGKLELEQISVAVACR